MSLVSFHSLFAVLVRATLNPDGCGAPRYRDLGFAAAIRFRVIHSFFFPPSRTIPALEFGLAQLDCSMESFVRIMAIFLSVVTTVAGLELKGGGELRPVSCTVIFVESVTGRAILAVHESDQDLFTQG